MTSSPPGPAGVFDRAADDYDAVGVPWFGPIANALVSRLDVQPGERVLDLGCGRGAALRLLADAVGPRGSVLGLDLAPRMVALTADELADRSHVEVRVGDAADPAVPPSSMTWSAARWSCSSCPTPWPRFTVGARHWSTAGG